MKELKNTGSELSKLKKENPFDVPEHYFDDFSSRLQVKLENEKTGSKEKEFRWINILKPAIGLAASFAIIMMLVYVPLRSFMPGEEASKNIATSDYSDIEFQNLLEEMDENSFFALLENGNHNDDLSDEDLLAYVNTNFTSYEIFEYTAN